jgi:hypothetical protein
MRLASLLIVAPFLVSSVAAQESKAFKDWVVGCDNLRACTALGFPSDYAQAGSYVKVIRSGEATAEPSVVFVTYVDSPEPGATLALAFDDKSLSGLPSAPLPLDTDESFLTAALSGNAARNFIGALNKASSLTMTILAANGQPDADATAGVVSLSGASAALLYMDDMQKRVGTTTALRSPGGKDDATIPAPPAEPVIAAVKMTEVNEALPPDLAAIAKKHSDDGDCPSGLTPITMRLSPSLMLWGVCTSAGAYNFFYDFSLVENGKIRPAVFEIPKSLGHSSGTLTNPSLSDDGLSISQFDKGRGIGDCGVSGAWAWDGEKFRLVDYAAMDTCMGVFFDDWPVLYRAQAK